MVISDQQKTTINKLNAQSRHDQQFTARKTIINALQITRKIDSCAEYGGGAVVCKGIGKLKKRTDKTASPHPETRVHKLIILIKEDRKMILLEINNKIVEDTVTVKIKNSLAG